MTFIMRMDELKSLAMSSPLALSAIAFVIVIAFVKYLLSRPKRLDIPIVGSPDSKDLLQDMLYGVAKYPDTPFIIPLSPPMVILPHSIMEEVRNLPERQVSFMAEVRRMFLHRHTGIGEDRPELTQAVKVDLTRHIASTLDGLQDEIKYALDKEFGPCEDWTAIKINSKLARVVALLSGRVFVGRPLSREEAWLDSTIKYTFDCNSARLDVLKYKVWARPFVAPFLASVRGVRRHKTEGAKLLAPLLKSCLKKAQTGKADSEGYEDEQGTFINWVLRHTDEVSRADPVILAANQMNLSFAAIHTTTMTTTNVLYDLACRPEYIEPLVEEINKVLEEDGYDLDGEGFLKLKKMSMPKLRKLDSFIKESQRMSPLGYISNTRVTTSNLSLSTGHTLPKGTRFAIPSHAVQTSPESKTFSPEYNPPQNKPPSEFDGLRFYRLRGMEGQENKHQFVTTSLESLNFGHGNHACPGRFFASNEIKVVLIELLRNWEFRLKDDVERKGGEDKRPEAHIAELGCTPNMFAELEFRRRKTANQMA